MGTDGRSGVRQAPLGSVATAVMHHAGRPVTVVPESFVPGD
jgi:nucleotide-binding universal stress UspA family protein